MQISRERRGEKDSHVNDQSWGNWVEFQDKPGQILNLIYVTCVVELKQPQHISFHCFSFHRNFKLLITSE